MMIPPRFLDEIRNRLNLSDIIGRRIALKRAGREYKACCPFHNEKSPSFTVNDDKQFYHCFGCGAHGDVIGFVMRHDNLSFPETVEMLATEAGLQIPKPDPQSIERAERAKDLYGLLEAATAWMQDQLTAPAHKDVLDYLEKRGLGTAVQQNFKLGYTPANGQALRLYLKEKGYDDAMMIEAGLLKESTKGGEPYTFFRDRVMFPVTDRRGRVVAFGGRILPEHIRPQTGDFKPPKYINSSDTPLFDKGRMLYGESHARQAARDGHSILVTEGYMDVIAVHQAGFKGAVAPMGTALTEEQIMSLWSMIPAEEKIPVLCFDGDNAGRSAAARSLSRILPLLKPNQSVRFAFLPDGEDPDSIVRGQGTGAFKGVLQASMGLFDFLWATHTAGRDLQTPEQRAGLEKTLKNEIAQIKDNDVQRYYNQLLRAKISETFFTPYKNKKRGDSPSAMKLKKPRMAANDTKDRILLAAVINHPAIYPQIEDAFGGFTPAHPRLNALRQSIMMACEDAEAALDSAALQHHLECEGYTQERDDILSESVYVHAGFCRPDAREPYEVAQEWLKFWQSLDRTQIAQEVQTGWREALLNDNEDEEEKLRTLMRITDEETP